MVPEQLDRDLLQKFIVFESIDGGGKDTQHDLVIPWLHTLRYTTTGYSEPNDQTCILGKKIRRHLTHKLEHGEQPPQSPFEFQRWYVISRAVNAIVMLSHMKPTHDFTLLVRYCYSTFAYGMAGGASMGSIELLHDVILGPNFYIPDVVYYIDVTAEEAMRRIRQRLQGKTQEELFEKKEFLDKVRASYLRIATNLKGRGTFKIIDGMGTREEVFTQIREDMVYRFKI